MLINLSNHPSKIWTKKQIAAAQKKYKSVIDLPFPKVSPNASTKQVAALAKRYAERCVTVLFDSKDKNNAVHIMGELNFTYKTVGILKDKQINCIASTTKRDVKEEVKMKISRFEFVKFREY